VGVAGYVNLLARVSPQGARANRALPLILKGRVNEPDNLNVSRVDYLADSLR
jgi:hypothetical protein